MATLFAGRLQAVHDEWKVVEVVQALTGFRMAGCESLPPGGEAMLEYLM